MNKDFMNNPNASKILGQIIIYGLLFVFVIFLISHYIDKKSDKKVVATSMENYISDHNITGKQEELMIAPSKESKFDNEENAVNYHTIEMQKKTELSDLISQVSTVHLNVIKSNGSKEILKDADEKLANIQSGMEKILSDVKAIVPPAQMADKHTQLIASLSVGVVEIEAYRADVAGGKIKGPSPNEHFNKLKALF